MITQVQQRTPSEKKHTQMRQKTIYEMNNDLEERLLQEAEFYIYRKKKDEQKKRKVKKMQDAFQKERMKKKMTIFGKMHHSQQVKDKQRAIISTRMKKNSEHFQSVVSKITANHARQLDRNFTMRNQIYSRQNSFMGKAASKTSRDHVKLSRAQSFDKSAITVEEKIENINQKVQKARSIHQLYKQEVVSRIREKSKMIDQVQQRLKVKELKEEEQLLRECYEMNEDLEKHYNRAKSLNEKKIQQRRHSFKKKLQKCSANIRHLEYAEEQRHLQIEKKIDRHHTPRQWKDERLKKYLQLWSQNNKILQEKRDAKAEGIIKKHQDISKKNRLYRERRDKLIQQYKYNQI